MNSSARSLVLGIACVAAAAGLESIVERAAFADEFRVDSAVYLEDEREAVSETLTLFSDGLIYDFLLTGSKEITVLDPKRGRVILLDPLQKRMTIVSTAEILEFTESARTEATVKASAALDWIDPKFKSAFDPATRTVKMTSPSVEYEAVCAEPKQPEAAAEFRVFADWLARLNAMRPGNGPPFARLKLNAELADRGMIPHSVRRTIHLAQSNSRKTRTVRSDHLTVWTLSKRDRDRIGDVSDYLSSFERVSFNDYREATRAAAGQ